jgi:hypothetical protein
MGTKRTHQAMLNESKGGKKKSTWDLLKEKSEK